MVNSINATVKLVTITELWSEMLSFEIFNMEWARIAGHPLYDNLYNNN